MASLAPTVATACATSVSGKRWVIIDAVSTEKGLQFVFGLEQAAIVWWSPAVDISAEVVKRLDAAK